MRNVVRIAIVVSVLAVPAIAVAGGHQVWAVTCTNEQYRPARITLSCADAGIWLGRLTWSHWSRTSAVATGSYEEIVCKPTCAAGHLVTRPVKVTLTQPRPCPGHAHPAFRRATLAFPSGAPPYAYHRFTFGCPFHAARR
jgi:hypothetical protein